MVSLVLLKLKRPGESWARCPKTVWRIEQARASSRPMLGNPKGINERNERDKSVFGFVIPA